MRRRDSAWRNLLADGPKRVEELATTTAAHAPSLRRLLRYLASIEVIYEDADGRLFSRSNMTKRAVGGPNHFKFSLVGVVFERSLDLLVMTRGLAKVLTSTILSDNAYASKSAGIGVSTKSRRNREEHHSCAAISNSMLTA
jgi:hypothetical protein